MTKESQRKKLIAEAQRLADRAFATGFEAGVQHIHGIRATDLLKRMVEMYGEIPLTQQQHASDPALWRDYYLFTGRHMICTEEGWEPGESKQSYLDEYGPDSILDEVNAPQEQKV